MKTYLYTRKGYPTFILKADGPVEAVRLIAQYVKNDRKVNMKISHLKDYAIEELADNSITHIEGELCE